MPGPEDLYACLEEFFELCVVALNTTPDGAPECRYLSEGPPPFDTMPSLTAYVGGPSLADTLPLSPTLAPGHRATVQAEVNLVPLTATVLRCATVIDESGNLPSAAAHAAVTYQMTQDFWAIWNHLRAAKSVGTLFPPKERELFMDPAVAVNQQGGACGWQIPIRVTLYGYKIP